MTIMSQFVDMTPSSNFFNVILFLWSRFVTGPSFMSIPSPVLELWQFSFIRDTPEIRKLKILLSEFYPIPGDWVELKTPNLTQMSLIKCYWALQNATVTVFTVSKLLRESQQEGGKIASHLTPPTSTQPRLGIIANYVVWNLSFRHHYCFLLFIW